MEVFVTLSAVLVLITVIALWHVSKEKRALETSRGRPVTFDDLPDGKYRIKAVVRAGNELFYYIVEPADYELPQYAQRTWCVIHYELISGHDFEECPNDRKYMILVTGHPVLEAEVYLEDIVDDDKW